MTGSKTKKIHKVNKKGTKNPQKKPQDQKCDKEKEIPLCLWDKNKKENILHLLKDCKDCSKDEKDRLFNLLRS